MDGAYASMPGMPSWWYVLAPRIQTAELRGIHGKLTLNMPAQQNMTEAGQEFVSREVAMIKTVP